MSTVMGTVHFLQNGGGVEGMRKCRDRSRRGCEWGGRYAAWPVPEGRPDVGGRVEGWRDALVLVLTTISLAWTCISMAIKRAEMGELFAEIGRFIMVTDSSFGC
jgi:hypothetical protein